MFIRFRNSSFSAILSLVGVNIIPFGWVFYGKWSVANLILFYWLETLVIGFYNVLKIRKAVLPITSSEENLMKRQLFGRFFDKVSRDSILKLFFIQYSFILFVYGIFLFAFIVPVFLVEGQNYIAKITAVASSAGTGFSFLLSFFAFFVSHGISYFTNFIGTKEYLKFSPARQMLQPYERIIAMHFFVVVGAIILGNLHNLGLGPQNIFFTIIAFILVKFLADLASHIKEHMIARAVDGEKKYNNDLYLKIIKKWVIFRALFKKNFFVFISLAIVSVFALTLFFSLTKTGDAILSKFQLTKNFNNNIKSKLPASSVCRPPLCYERAMLAQDPDLRTIYVSYTPYVLISGTKISFDGVVENSGDIAVDNIVARLRIDIGKNGSWDVVYLIKN